MPTTTLPDFWPALPEAVLAGLAMLLLLLGAVLGERPARSRAALVDPSVDPMGGPRRDATARLVSWLAILALLVVLAIDEAMGGTPRFGFYGMFVNDTFGLFMNTLILLGSATAILLSLRYNEDLGIARFEFPVLVLLATTGMMVMVSANDLILLYVGLELQNLALYVVASFDRDSVRSSEAGLKYFVLSALSSGMLLYGISLVYGFAGTTGFTELAKLVAGSAPVSAGLIIGIIFVLVGLAFKVSAVPFHMWTPDVYEGAPTPVTAFFSVAPKMAALALFIRFMLTPFGALVADWRGIIIFLSVASMVFGAVAAIAQQNIKRLMAYSSISHIGYALIGLASATASGIRGILVYMAVYLVMNLGTWAVILCMRRRGRMVEGIADLAGLSRTQPGLALALGIFMFSLTGIPPTAGFFAKLYIFIAAINAHLTWLAVIGVVTSVIGAFYYLRIVKVMYFDEPVGGFDRPISAELKGVLVVTALLTLFFFAFPESLSGAAQIAATALFPR
jgi:NADH-quinone oxidoreductase subunit N